LDLQEEKRKKGLLTAEQGREGGRRTAGPGYAQVERQAGCRQGSRRREVDPAVDADGRRVMWPRPTECGGAVAAGERLGRTGIFKLRIPTVFVFHKG
jgi:hypothetical protein